ncbi:MAG: Uma2 family endonuclease [Acidobacteriota bacterium]
MTTATELQMETPLDPDKSYEIVNGQPEEKEMPGARHSGICTRLGRKLGDYAEAKGLGEIYQEASFQIGEHERIPDLAFISTLRIPLGGEPETKWPIPPDLAVEVTSPNDFYEKVYAKAMEYLAAGVKQVWLVSPENQTITVFRSPTNIIAFPPESELVIEDLFPGFHCPLSEIFKTPRPAAQQE